MRKCLFLLMMSRCLGGMAAPAYWSGVQLTNGEIWGSNTHLYSFDGYLISERGTHASVLASLYGHEEGGRLFLEQEDFSHELDPTINRWALAIYGEIIGENTFLDAIPVPSTTQYDYEGKGVEVENRSDFYMVFKASEIVWDGHEYTGGQAWYGWVHVSIDENLDMTLLEDGINLDGGPVTVGIYESGIPEPSSALLLIVGGALLALVRLKGVQRNLIR